MNRPFEITESKLNFDVDKASESQRLSPKEENDEIFCSKVLSGHRFSLYHYSSNGLLKN
jgi:hypothetical protein